MGERDEYTFLCGYQKIRRYGSTDDLNSPPASFRNYSRLVLHKLEPSDTLQSLELKYNSSVFEIKRVNRLWSNDSLHCRTHVNIPIYDDANGSAAQTPTRSSSSTLPPDATRTSTLRRQNGSSTASLPKLEEAEPESVDDIFRRIDLNMKETKKAVRRLNRNNNLS
ncbi:LysM domain containing protein [Aphelenchoides avenae]|nr:LysM domain containing protein [Aphelenchus avenae]